VTLAPDAATVPLRAPHAWTLRVATAEGRLFFPDQLAIDGGMPGHGHGLSTEPAVTRLLEDGTFLVEGMVFNMAGTWQLRVGVMGDGGWDVATFEFIVGADGVLTGADQRRMSGRADDNLVMQQPSCVHSARRSGGVAEDRRMRWPMT
jgi:hypothetical protein